MFFGRDESFVAESILDQPLASCTMKEKEMIGGCCVCSDEKGYSDNPLVYCDGKGCDVAVHQGLLISRDLVQLQFACCELGLILVMYPPCIPN